MVSSRSVLNVFIRTDDIGHSETNTHLLASWNTVECATRLVGSVAGKLQVMDVAHLRGVSLMHPLMGGEWLDSFVTMVTM